MIKQIVTHGSPAHLDEAVAYLQLRDRGEEKLPGVGTAAFRCLTSGDSLEALAQREDVVLLGLGAKFRNESNEHRIFDEHVADDDKSQKDECAATLVAKFLGLDQEFRWRRILKGVLHTDKNPPNLIMDPAATIMRLQLQGWPLHRAVQHVEVDVRAALEDADRFGTVSLLPMAETEFTFNNQKHQLVVIEGDNEKAPAFARFLGASVVVVKNSSGHVQILTANNLRLDMRDIVRVLRLREQWIRREKNVTAWRKLEQEGTIEEVPEWFWHKDSNNILNGGRSRPDIPATKISLDTIVETVKICLEGGFEPSRQEKCKKGICTSTLNNQCRWYNLALLRCRAIQVKRH